jgi:hypothetical protein
MNESDWSRYYKNRNIHEEFKRKEIRHKPYFETIGNISPNKKALEIGIGFGTCFAIMNKQFGFKTTGIENDKQMLQIAQRNLASLGDDLHKQIVAATGFNLPFLTKSYSTVYSQGLMEHFEDEQIHNLIEEGLRVADFFCFSVPTKNFVLQEHLIGNERLLSKSQWEKIIGKYKIVKSETYSAEEEYFAIVSERSA